jgi:transposase
MKFKCEVPVYLWQGACDMRCSFDRLSSLVTEHIKTSVISGGAYVFFSRCRKKVKILYWDHDGFAIWHKRLEAGSYKVAKVDSHEVVTAIDLEDLLRGTDFSRIKLRKNAENGSFNHV